MTAEYLPGASGSVSAASSATPTPTVSRISLASVAMDAEDVAHALELREHARELLDARPLKRRVHRRGLVGVGEGRERHERDLVLADDRGHVAQEPIAVPAFDPDRDRIRARRRPLPLHLDMAFLLGAGLHVRAVSAMDGHAAAAGDRTDDRIARDARAAGRSHPTSTWRHSSEPACTCVQPARWTVTPRPRVM